MDSSKDYYRTNKGFSVNGTMYRRLLGTNGGVKKFTITYVSERIYNEIKNKPIKNGWSQHQPANEMKHIKN